MQTNYDVKDVNTVAGAVDSEDVEETGLILLCAAAPTFCEPSLGTTSEISEIERKLTNLNFEPPREITKRWTIGVIPLPSNEYRRARTVFNLKGVNEVTIAARLFLLMKKRNIYAVYKDSTVTCKTSSYMKFTIRLLRDPKDAESILVDVRRRAGCAMSFRNEHQAIRRSVLYGECDEPEDRRVMPESFANKIPLGEDVIEQSLRASVKDLESKYYDARELTVQDLNSTTDPASKDTSPRACELILEKFPKILDYIINDVKKRVDYGDLNDDDSDEYLRSLTLNLLCNILSSDADNKTLMLRVNDESIIEHLVWYVSQASTCPWNACLAAKCLGLLKTLSSKDNEVRDALLKAGAIGKIMHDLLETEVNIAISAINGCK